MFRYLFFLLILQTILTAAAAANPADERLASAVKTFFSRQQAEEKIDHVYVGIHHIESGVSAYLKKEKDFALGKGAGIYVMAAVLDAMDRGEISGGEMLTLTDGVRCVSGGIGALENGRTFTVEECLESMMRFDDTTAMQMLWQRLGPDGCRKFLRSKKYTQTNLYISPRALTLLGLGRYSGLRDMNMDQFSRQWNRTKYEGRLEITAQVLEENRNFPGDELVMQEGLAAVNRRGADYFDFGRFMESLDNRSTVWESTRFMKQLYSGELLSPASTERAKALLKSQRSDGLALGLPEDTPLWHVFGASAALAVDMGVIEIAPDSHVCFSIVTRRVSDFKMNDAEKLISRFGREVYDFFRRERGAAAQQEMSMPVPR